MYNRPTHSSLNWDYNQEQKEKYANRVRQLAKEISNETDESIIPSILNDFYSFLAMVGYSDEVIYTQKNSLDHFDAIRGKEAIVKCMNRFADSILSSELPKRQSNISKVNITNTNNNTNNNTFDIKVVEDAISQELSSDQIEELRKLIESRKGGDIKKWFSDLGSGTLSGILSSLVLKIPELFAALPL